MFVSFARPATPGQSVPTLHLLTSRDSLTKNGHSKSGVALNTTREKTDAPSPAALLAGMGAFVIVGVPAVFFIWRFVNEILAGRFYLMDAGLALVFLVIFLGLLKVLAGRVRAWDAQLSA